MRSLMFGFVTIFVGDVNFAERGCIFTLWSDWFKGISIGMGVGDGIFIHHDVAILIERFLVGDIDNR